MANNVYFSLLPSEICRLVLGYLNDLGCVQTFNTFFQECAYLEELRKETQTGCTMTYRVGGFTLVEILKDYFTIANMGKSSYFMPNEKRESIIRKWTDASLPNCHPGEVAPLLVCLFSDSHAIETALSPPQGPGHITTPVRTSTLTPVVSLPSMGSPRRITVLRSKALTASTQNRVKLVPSVRTLSSTPKVVLKVVRTQSGTVSAQSSSTSPSSSRRKIHSKPVHVTAIAANPAVSEDPSLNIQRVFCNLAANAETVANRINSNLGNGASCEASLSQLDFPLPAEIDQGSLSLSEQDMHDFINRLLSDVDSLGSKSPVKTGADTAAVAPLSPPPSSTVTATVIPSGRTETTSGVTPRGRIPVKPTSNPSFESIPDEQAVNYCFPATKVTSPATTATETLTRTTSASSSSFTTSTTIPSTFKSPPKRPRLTARRALTRMWTRSQRVPCEEYPSLPSQSSAMESSREDAIYNPRESLSAPNSVHATTLDSDNSTWQYTCVLPPSTHIVDLDSSPAEDPRVVTRTSAARATMALTTQAPLSAPPALSETNTNGIDELNCLPSVFPNIPPKENFTSGDFGEFASIWVSQGIGASNPPLPVVDLSNPTVKPIPIEFITLRHADSDRTLSQPASTRLSNSRLLDYINSEMGEVDLQHHQCTPHTLRPHRRRRSTQSSLPPPPPSSPLASLISFSPSGAKENVAPGPSGPSASASASTSAADANAPRPKNKKYQRHKKMVNDYLQYYGGSRKDFRRDTTNDKRDIDVIKANARFVWENRDNPETWEERLAKHYWDRLYKEYAIADFSRLKEKKLGLRWRSEREVVSGKGQFVCGAVDCNEVEFLRSWEVDFVYKERGEKRNALVKVRLCPACSQKLNHHKQHSEVVPKIRTEEFEEERKVAAPQEHREPTPRSDLWKGPSASDQRMPDQPHSQRTVSVVAAVGSLGNGLGVCGGRAVVGVCGSGSAALPRLGDSDFECLKQCLSYRLEAGQGECFVVLGVGESQEPGLSTSDMSASEATLQSLTQVAVVGNVDAGKSTMLGVLTHGELDNGRGLARQYLFRHKHEIESGRTSSVGNNILGFDADGKVVNRAVHGKLDWAGICQAATKVITFIDLAGHERYLKTTVFGLVGFAPDFVMLMVGANAGVIGMTKEHLGLALALSVPVFVVVTKIDMCPPNVLNETLNHLFHVLKSPGCRKIPLLVSNHDDVVCSATNFTSERMCPVFLVSNVTGSNLDLLTAFLNLLSTPSPTVTASTTTPTNSIAASIGATTVNSTYRLDQPASFQIDELFTVPGVGAIVSGTCMSGVVRLNDTLSLGPDTSGRFFPVVIKSVQRKRLPVNSVRAGQTASFSLKRPKGCTQLRRGMMLLGKGADLTSCINFTATVLVLHHPTTISVGYQAMVHAGPIRQTATILSIGAGTGKERLRTGDRAEVHFAFINHPECLHKGARLIFREGKTKAVGTVNQIVPYQPVLAPVSGGRSRKAQKAPSRQPTALPVSTAKKVEKK
uniref:Tr-type G domain-containing protein n=1 Tax=Echinococcus canadensis TaxID=519352 RepID=A0A915EXF3_9CEST